MRIYVPVTAADLVADELSPRQVHGVTAAQQAEFPAADQEYLELVATVYAADDAMDLLAEQREIAADQGASLPPLRRLVAVGIAPDKWIQKGADTQTSPAATPAAESPAAESPIADAPTEELAQLPTTAMQLTHPLAWSAIESIHVDEPGSEPIIARAIAGDEEAFAQAANITLLWYDVTEREMLAAELLPARRP